MDGSQFDTLVARLTATRLTRTAALRGVGAGALTAVLAAAGVVTPGGAKRKKNRKQRVCRCPTADATTCTGTKARKRRARRLATQACNYRGRCQPGTVGAQCRCPGGQTRCGQTCVNLNSDPTNCGACGTVCAAGLACEGGTCCLPATADLQAALAAAGSTLRLCAGTWTVSSTLQIGQNLTLVGAGAGQSILDGGDAVRVLRVAGGVTATVRDLTITNGRATGTASTDGGGGIVNEGTLTLRGVTVSSNRSEYAAGGINNFGTLTLQDGTRVTGNSAQNGGGGIANFRFDATLTLQAGSQVAGNSAQNGGGIKNDSGTVTLQAGSLIGGDAPGEANSATSGGGIHTGGTLTLEAGSRIAGNSATYQGGGIYNDNSTVTLQGGSRVSGNSAGSGGGIYNELGMVTLQADALVCGNTPANDQCSGGVTGTCPNPTDGVCPPA